MFNWKGFVMTTFTVVGFYEDTGQRFCHTVEADGWVDAVEGVCQMFTDGELVIVEVFEGDLVPLTKASKIEYRVDWVQAEEDCDDDSKL